MMCAKLKLKKTQINNKYHFVIYVYEINHIRTAGMKLNEE